MARRRSSITTPLRYMIKAIRAHGGEPPKELLNTLALAQYAAWEVGLKDYKRAWEIAEGVLQAMKVPKAMYGLYRSFVMEYVNKVKKRGILTDEELITIWERKGGIDRKVMEEIIKKLKR